MEGLDNADASLIPFLRKLADSIENGQLLPRQLQHIGEFFMSYQFQEQAIRDGEENTESPGHSFSKSELIKFIVMGWHIYSCILTETSISTD